MSREEFSQRWDAGEGDFLVTAFFETDIHDLSKILRDWCVSPRGEFPSRFGPESVTSPVIRTAAAIRFPGVRERVWHRDRPITFEFRPVSRHEAYHMEAAYWRSVKDERRALLADEICARLEDDAQSEGNGPAGGTSVESRARK
jgi:hypothetical protein